MKKTKRDDDDVGDGRLGGAKRRHLDPLLETDAKFLLHDFKSSDELLKLYDRVVDLEDQLVDKMDFDDGIKAIEGAKADAEGQTMWFLVRWEGDTKSFVPANVLRKIAPGKLIRYYESRMQIHGTPIPGPVGVSHLTKVPGQNGQQNRPAPSTAPSKPLPGPGRPTGSSKPKPPAPKPNPPKYSIKPVPILPKYKTMHCVNPSCKCLLQYPPNTKHIRCPKCQTQMATLEEKPADKK